MKKLIVFVVLLAALGTGGWAYYQNRTRPEPTVTTVPVSRGEVVERVQATGTLEAVTTVTVGTQVSGVVQELYADFNSIVRKGQVIARLDPSILQVQIESQKANVVRAEADLERLRVALADAQQKFDRAKAMFAKELVPKTDYEAAELAVKSADAQIKSSEASLTQSKASLNQATVNMGYTVITSPIDGIVISRNVEPGQTVASSMNAPTLFVIAADLTKMQVVANIDESDVGRMRPGQVVSFRVDAYPTDTFIGAVEQVRLQPAVVQNVVVYSTVIAVPNPQLKLKPGMTATVGIEIARRNNVVRVPTAAVRFRPTEAMFTVLNQPVPPEVTRGGGFAAAAAAAKVAVVDATVAQARVVARRKAHRRLEHLKVKEPPLLRRVRRREPMRQQQPRQHPRRPRRGRHNRRRSQVAAAARTRPRLAAAVTAWRAADPAEAKAAARSAAAKVGAASAAGEAVSIRT